MTEPAAEPPQTAARRGPWPAVAAAAALLAMAPVGFFYGLSGLVATAPGVYLMWLLYLGLLALAIGLARRRSYWVLAVPVASAAAWVALVNAGARWWGWQA